MSALNRFVALFIAGLALLAVLVFSQAASAARPLATGVTTPDSTVLGKMAYDRIAQSGATHTRIIVFWSRTVGEEQPVGWNPEDPADPNYDWSYPDQQVRDAVAAGLTPLIQIHSAPKWAERCHAPDEPGICDPDPAAFVAFATAALKRYSGSFDGLPWVRYWQPWNEPNLHIFFKPQRRGAERPSPTLYRTLLNQFATAVKVSNPRNLVVGGGLAPLGGTNSIGPLDFTRRLLCMKGRAKPKPIRGCNHKTRFDIWAVNPYTTGGPTHQAVNRDDVQLGDLPEMARLIKAAKRAGKIVSSSSRIPFWVTEFSWDSRPPDPGGLPMSTLTRWTAEAMYRSWQAGVENFFWFTLRDWPRVPGEPYANTIESGLYFRGATLAQDRPKRVLQAFEFPFVAFRKANSISIWGRTAKAKSGRVVIRYAKRSRQKGSRIKVVRADRFGVFKANIRTKLGKKNRGFVTATFRGRRSVPFSLKPVKDFYHPPFGGPSRTVGH